MTPRHTPVLGRQSYSTLTSSESGFALGASDVKNIGYTRVFLKGTSDGVSSDGGQAGVLLDQATIAGNNIGLKSINGGRKKSRTCSVR
jgi:hypothetical protein